MVVTLVLSNLASWKFRFVDRLSKWQTFLKMLELPPFDQSDSRASIAATYLRKLSCCLDDRDGDLFMKVRDLFLAEWQQVASDGTVPLKLYIFILLLRSEAPTDMQEVEGMISVLQLMSKRAPTLQVALASARMQIKKGDAINATECAELNESVKQPRVIISIGTSHWCCPMCSQKT